VRRYAIYLPGPGFPEFGAPPDGFVPAPAEFVAPPPVSPPGGKAVLPVLSDEFGGLVVGGFVAIELDVFAFSLFITFMFSLVFAIMLLLVATLAVVPLHSCIPTTEMKTVVNNNTLIMIPFLNS